MTAIIIAERLESNHIALNAEKKTGFPSEVDIFSLNIQSKNRKIKNVPPIANKNGELFLIDSIMIGLVLKLEIKSFNGPM